MGVAVSEELQRRFEALQAADRAWRDHQVTDWQALSRARYAVSTSASAVPRAWLERDEQLRARFEAARAEWLACLVPKDAGGDDPGPGG